MGVQHFISAKMGIFSPTFASLVDKYFFTHFAFLVKSIFRQFADNRNIQKKETNSNITFLSCGLATTPLTVVYRQTKTLTTNCS